MIYVLKVSSSFLISSVKIRNSRACTNSSSRANSLVTAPSGTGSAVASGSIAASHFLKTTGACGAEGSVVVLTFSIVFHFITNSRLSISARNFSEVTEIGITGSTVIFTSSHSFITRSGFTIAVDSSNCALLCKACFSGSNLL